MKKITLLLFAAVLGLTNMSAQISQPSIQVAGKASVNEIAEEIVFRIPIKMIDSSYIGCNDRLSYTLNEFQKELREKGISEKSIHTSNYSITTNMIYEDGKRVQKGYQGKVNLVVSNRYSPELIQKVLQSINSFQFSYNVNFSMSESQKHRLTKIAMENAVEDAKHKAMILANASNVQLGAILKISYEIDQYRSEPFLSERIMSSQAEDIGQNDLNLSPPLTSLHKSVLIVWEIK